MNILTASRQIARLAHAGQKYGDRGYVEAHVYDVVERVSTDPQATIAHVALAYLHDTLEDTSLPIEPLRTLIGECAGPVVLDALDAITRRTDEPYSSYIDRVAACPMARLVKIHDLRANRQALSCPAVRRRRYQRAIARLRDASAETV